MSVLRSGVESSLTTMKKKPSTASNGRAAATYDGLLRADATCCRIEVHSPSPSPHVEVAGESGYDPCCVEINSFSLCKHCQQQFMCACCAACCHRTIRYRTASKPRVTNITFSTVTSATGLPTIVAEPSRPRSSSFWKPEVDENGKLREEGSESSNSTWSTNDTVESLTIQTIDGTLFDRPEIDKDAHLARVLDWNFPIFDFASHNPTTVLSKLAYTIFKRADLFRIFKVSPVKFFNYFHALEKGYWEIPYHNRLHAADVLHGCCYMTAHP
uniref:PDEase domain-containing protein n=1 Tax=Plectus sambesii TaxID=2011161 RepID=A0A914VWY8_9BILA